MAQRIWSSLVSNDLNLATNYTGSGTLLAIDDLLFLSGVSAVATSNLYVNSLTTSGTYSGGFNTSGYFITTSSGVVINHSGMVTLGDVICSGDLTVGSNIVASGDFTSCNLYMKNNSNLSINKNNMYFNSVNLAYPNTTVNMSVGSGMTCNTNSLSINGGSYIFESVASTFKVLAQTSNPLTIAPNSYIHVGYTNNMLYLSHYQPSGTNLTINVPSIHIYGSGRLYINKENYSSGNCTFNLGGELYAPEIYLRCGNNDNASNCIFNVSGCIITCKADTYADTGHTTNGVFSLSFGASGNPSKINFVDSIVNAEYSTLGGISTLNEIYMTNSSFNLYSPKYGASLLTTIPFMSSVFINSSISILVSGSMTGKNINFDTIIIDTPNSLCKLNDSITMNRLKITPSSNCVLKSLSSYIINDYHMGDWEDCSITASTLNSGALVTNPEYMKVYNVNFRDCTFSKPITTYNCSASGTVNLGFPNFTIIPKKINSIFRRFLRR